MQHDVKSIGIGRLYAQLKRSLHEEGHHHQVAGMTSKEAEDSQLGEAAAQALHRPPGEGMSKTAKRRQRDKAKIEKLQDDHSRQRFRDTPWRQQQQTGKGGWSASSTQESGHPRKAGRGFQTDREGNQICFSFAKGPLGSCSEPCPQQRTQYCLLGSHPNAQCQSKGKGKGGKKGNRK